MVMKKKGIIIMLLFCITIVFSIGCIEENTVEYQITFHATWSQETHPDDFPESPHFSGLIGASHNQNVTFWSIGSLASPGIQNMAETGSKDPLTKEINIARLKRDAYDIISGDGVETSPDTITVTVKVSENYPLVTLVTMIAPSPDWFVGVNGLNLFENGSFIDEKTVVLYPYDAGTDSGTSYTSSDEPTQPPVPISLLDDYPFVYEDELVPLGSFVFTKLN
jgi:hypothetical protein